MFTCRVPEFVYRDPWILPLAMRQQALIRGQRRVAYFYEEPNNSTFRYRAYNMVHVLNETPGSEVSASYFFLDDLGHIDNLADLADILVVCRSRYCHRIHHLISTFRRRHKRVFFDVDDLVFDPDYVHLIMETLDQNPDNPALWDHWYAYIARMGAALKLCDAAIATNQYLADRIADYSGLPIGIVPNFINQEQMEISESIYASKIASGFDRDDRIDLGYFSGSPSHNRDFEMIVPALEDLLADHPQIALHLTGYIDCPDSLHRFKNRITKYAFHDYVNLQRLTGRVEFNLVPLQSNIFTHCKSELKYFEAAITGTISIASPTYTYGLAIRNEENGYLARGHQWASVIRQAINDMDSYPERAQAAFTDVRDHYAWFNQREVILKALDIA
jgi:glycosyltransferase involved in cell wall biosynthesis